MKKRLKKSKRGLTFSFSQEGTNFKIGSHYKYIFDKNSKKIFMILSEDSDSLKISRKKCGRTLKSLIDIRAKKVISKFDDSDYITVEIKKNIIIVDGYREVESEKSLNLCQAIKETKCIFHTTVKTKEIDKLECNQLSFFDNVFKNINDDNTVNDTKRAIKVFSVFSGVGMLDKPFSEDDKFEIVKAVEINKSACDSYRVNIGDMIVQGDIRKVKESDIPESDLLLGGTSCKVYSNANRHIRPEEHKDNDLLNHYIRLVKLKDFKTFILENVVQLVTLKKGLYLQMIKDELPEYNIKCFILNDNECGGFTTRKRVFIVGSKLGEITEEAPIIKGGTVGDALAKVNKEWFNYKDITKSGADVVERMKYIPQGGNWMDIPKELWKSSYKVGKTHSNTFRRLCLDKPSITLANFRKCNLIHPTENRGINVAEALAISGFNKDFKVFGTLADKQLGVANGVPYKMAKMIKNIIKRFFRRIAVI